MVSANLIEIEIVYALPDQQALSSLQVSSGSTVEQAIQMSGILRQFPEIDLDKNRVGIYSRLVKPSTVVQPRDRIEIYRPLFIDPKTSRRLRIKQKQVKS